MIIFGLLLSASISTADLRREFLITPHDAAVVRDAISRWTRKDNSSEAAMKSRVPIVVYFPRQRCVVLWLRAPSVGGTPTYCYELQSDTLIEANDDVE